MLKYWYLRSSRQTMLINQYAASISVSQFVSQGVFDRRIYKFGGQYRKTEIKTFLRFKI